MRFIWWVNKATDTHSDYVTQIYFPYQQLLRTALGVTGLGFVCVCVYIYITLYTDYVQVPGYPLSSHAFPCTRKYGFVFKRNILVKSRVMNL